MPALAGQRDPLGPCRDQPRDAEPCAGTKHRDRPMCARRAAADRQPIRLGQERNGHRDGGEIVDHDEPLKAEPVAQHPHRKAPGMIGHPDLVAGDRGRDRQRADPRYRQVAARVQIGPDCVVDRREIVAGIGIRMKQRPARRDQPETGVGGADIADQPGRADRRPVPGSGHYRAAPAASASTKRRRQASVSLRGRVAVNPTKENRHHVEQ